MLETKTKAWASTGRNMANSPPSDIHESIAPSLIAYSVICQLVIVIVVSARFYIRLRLLRKFGMDDMALAATLVRAPVNYYPVSSGGVAKEPSILTLVPSSQRSGESSESAMVSTWCLEPNSRFSCISQC